MTIVQDNIAIVARQAVQAMVGRHIEVFVDADRLRLAEHERENRARAGGSVGAVVSVELAGPDGEPHKATRKVTARGEAAAWGIDEVVGAARRAAERILDSNPTWRRVSS